MASWFGLVVCLIVCYAAAGIGGLFTARAIPTWYRTLRKPAWNPPAWVFGPVWTLLYGLMAVAWWLAIRSSDGDSFQAAVYGVFLIQLALNVLWSYIFFGRQKIAIAAAEVVLLWLAILAATAVFGRINAVAAWMMAPYLAWVAFAAALNLTISKMNPFGEPGTPTNAGA